MSQLLLSWAHLDSDIPQLFLGIRRWSKKTGTDLKGGYVYCPPRGGLVFGVAVSHEFGMTMVTSLAQLRPLVGTAPILFVDDIVDTGKELGKFRNLCPDAPAFCWCLRIPVADGIKTPVHFVRAAENGQWVIFPWERQDNWETERSEYESSRK